MSADAATYARELLVEGSSELSGKGGRMRRARLTLAEFRATLRNGNYSRAELANELDRMHERLRDEVLRTLADAVNGQGGFVTFQGEPSVLVVPWSAVSRAVRASFDGRRRRKKG